MKVIDLLNKIANGEEVPKKIKKENNIYSFNDEWNFYQLENTWGGTALHFNLDNLNDEIEIIEEPKKIEKIEHEEVQELDCYKDVAYFFEDRLNEIIDYINKGDNND